MSHLIGCWQPQRCAMGHLIIVTYRCDSKMRRCLGHDCKICFVDAGVPDLLIPYEGTIPGEVREHDDLWLRLFARKHRIRNLARYGNPRTGCQLTERTPPVVAEKRVIGGRVN